MSSLSDILSSLGAKWATEAKRPERNVEPIPDRRAESMADSLGSVPELFAWATGETSWRAEAPARVDVAAAKQAYMKRAEPFVSLVGGSGGGKTSTAVRLFSLALTAEPWPNGLFVAAADLTQEARETHLGEAPRLLNRARAARVLVIDDLGQDSAGEWARPVIALLLDRHAHMKRTIVTTGFERAHIAERYGDGVARRLFEGGAVRFKSKQ